MVELEREESDYGATVKNELREKGCREIIAMEELKSSEEDDFWSNNDWLEELMLELNPPKLTRGVPGMRILDLAKTAGGASSS